MDNGAKKVGVRPPLARIRASCAWRDSLDLVCPADASGVLAAGGGARNVRVAEGVGAENGNSRREISAGTGESEEDA